MRIKRYAINFLLPVVWPLIKLYWRVFKPETHGVRILIIHPEDKNKILLVLHSYGNKSLWNIPGGGYNPKKEFPLLAAKREIREEFQKELGSVKEIGLYETTGEGKQDRVVIFVGEVSSPVFNEFDPEISKVSWEDIETVLQRGDVAKIVKYAIKLHLST